MDVLYYPPPLASGNLTHPCNSRYRGKILLYIDHIHIEYLYNNFISLCFETVNLMNHWIMNKCNACTKNQDNKIIFDILKYSDASTYNITRDRHAYKCFARVCL